MWEPDTAGNGCGFWPTPNTLEGIKPKPLENIIAHNKKARPGRSYLAMNLREKVYYGDVPHPDKVKWPTPSVGDTEGGSQWERVERGKDGGFKLRKQGKTHMTYGAKLRDAAMMDKFEGEGIKKKDVDNPITIQGQLNPDWVEWLMGMPISWSSLEPIDELVWLDWFVDPADVESDRVWTTPQSQDCKHSGSAPSDQNRDLLCVEAKKAERKWPTPNQRDWKGERGGQNRGFGIDINDAIAMLPTPRAFCHKDAKEDRNKSNLGEKVGPSLGLKLQPNFVEWMMGFPIGWTDLNLSETPSYHRSHTKS